MKKPLSLWLFILKDFWFNDEIFESDARNKNKIFVKSQFCEVQSRLKHHPLFTRDCRRWHPSNSPNVGGTPPKKKCRQPTTTHKACWWDAIVRVRLSIRRGYWVLLPRSSLPLVWWEQLEVIVSFLGRFSCRIHWKLLKLTENNEITKIY